MGRVIRLEDEEEEEGQVVIRRRPLRHERPGPGELLRRLVRLRLDEHVDGEAFWELLEAYASRSQPRDVDEALAEAVGRDPELEARLRAAGKPEG